MELFLTKKHGNEDGLQTIYRLRPTYHPTNLVTGEQNSNMVADSSILL